MKTQVYRWEWERSLYQMIQALAEGIAIEDESGRLLLVNRALAQLLGYEPGELVGLPWMTLIAAEYQEQAKAARLSQCSGVDEATTRYEIQLQRKDATRVSVLASSLPLSLGNQTRGKLSIFVPFHGDQVCGIKGMALLGERVASVIHELNNPLTIILLQTQLLRKSVASGLQVSESLEIIEDQIQRMRRLMNELLCFAGSHPPQFEEVDVNALIQRTVRLEGFDKGSVVQVVPELASDLPTMLADPDQLQQVFINILRNAREAIEGMNRAISRMRPQRGQITVTTALIPGDTDHNSRIQIRFADNGPGIRTEILSRIFEPFFTTKKGNGGTGLGLSICDRIAKQHGGRIWAENNEEGGATFTLELPVIAPAGRDPSSATDPQCLEIGMASRGLTRTIPSR
ncbi:MAG: two-component system sensor histidine kinase NtrB [Anaerolineae bacterium]